MFIEYKDGTKHAGTRADTSETMDAFQDCGMLLTDTDIVIDIDHLPKESIRAMIKEFGLKTMTVWTDRGAHLWFERPSWLTRRRDGICRLGFEIEQHNKGSNPNGMTIKRNGVARKIDNFGIRQMLPSIFKVDSKNAFENLTGMSEGEGRNKALYRHRQALIKAGAPDQEKIVAFINRWVFAEPLEDKEVELLQRDMTEAVSDDKEASIANAIMRDCRTVLYSGMIWWYDGTEYRADDGNEFLIPRIYQSCEGEKTRVVDEILKQISYRSPRIPGSTVFPIKFRNGIVRGGQFIPYQNYTDFTPFYIDVKYSPDAHPVEIVDQYINNLTGGDPAYRDLLMEVMGYVLVVDPERIRALAKFFMLRGDGANGKGTFLQILKRIYGEKNCTTMSIKQLVDDRFKVTMVGKLANLGDDIEPEAIDNDQLKILKNISTADAVSTRRLFSHSETVTFTAKLYFTTNSDIRSFEKGYAYKRRVLWLPMFNKVEQPDPAFISKITTQEALEYWVRLIVAGYMRLYSNRSWTRCEKVSQYNEMYHEENDVCLQFAKDLDPDTDIVGKTMSDMRTAFLEWDSEDRKFSGKQFKNAVWELYKIGIGKGRIAGKPRRVFLRQESTTQTLTH